MTEICLKSFTSQINANRMQGWEHKVDPSV